MNLTKRTVPSAIKTKRALALMGFASFGATVLWPPTRQALIRLLQSDSVQQALRRLRDLRIQRIRR